MLVLKIWSWGHILIDVSNITFLHTAIAAFESNGFNTSNIDTYNITTGNFTVAMTAFNLGHIASQLSLDDERFASLQTDFLEDKHYFSVGGCTATFIKADWMELVYQ